MTKQKQRSVKLSHSKGKAGIASVSLELSFDETKVSRAIKKKIWDALALFIATVLTEPQKKEFLKQLTKARAELKASANRKKEPLKGGVA